MYFQYIKNYIKLKSWNKARLAKAAGVSRAAVTRWFHAGETSGWVNVETGTLKKLAASLGVTPDRFLQPCPPLKPYHTLFLWDVLYPDMESFAKAITENRVPALARLTQVLGFHSARQAAGKKVIALFPRYKNHIKPARRKQLETVWELYCKPT